jgi:hypothetical protein
VLGYHGIEGFSGELSREIVGMPRDDRPIDVDLSDFAETVKLGFEAMKQIATLSAGSIVVIGTFLSNIFPADEQGALTVPWYTKLFIGAAFVVFGVSLFFSTRAMIRYNNALETFLTTFGQRVRFSPPARRNLINLPLVSFTVGLICFGIAVLLNLFFGS